MTRNQLNRALGVAPIVMSLLALALVMIAVTTGWQTRQADEGAAARLFQLLIFTQPLIILIFLGTAEGTRPMQIAGMVALQILAAGVALGALVYFEASGF